MDIDDLNTINRQQIDRAGARYTPGIKDNAPNIEIQHVLRAFDALAYSDAFKQRARDLSERLDEQWERAPAVTKEVFTGRVQTPGYVAELLDAVAVRSPGDDQQELYNLTRATRYAQERVEEAGANLRYELHEAEDREQRRSLNNKIDKYSRLERALGDVSDFVEGPEHALLGDDLLFLQGEWGTGKTHFLCDLTKRRMGEELPTLLLLAESLPDGVPPLEGICQATDLASDSNLLLKKLQEMGKDRERRALLLIDGINEGERSLWKGELAPLARKLQSFSHVGAAVSCRTPFDRQIVTNQTEDVITRVDHYGFEEQEVDAQVEFFDYYNIPSPHVPLLTPEFSRPLFLKILCQAIVSSGVSDRGEYLKNIASGQKGMTDVLEEFAKEIGSDIEYDFGLDANTCWEILKGTATGAASGSGIAGKMADELRKYISRGEAVEVVKNQTDLSGETAEDLLDRMITDGLLAETLHWDAEQEEVLRFPYERFGDHIIARHVLAAHLNTDSNETIRRSFYVDRPLGEIFELSGGSSRFKQPGLAAAVMLEFPERVKRVLPKDERELLWYLPKKRRRAHPMKEAFLDGLHWRDAESFGKDTDQIVGFFLDSQNRWTREETLEVLVGLATRPGHPYSAERLYDYLDNMAMPDRDLVWSEYIRGVGDGSPVIRLLEWVERTEREELSRQTASTLLRVLSVLLTTTKRPLRDRITRALFWVGLSHSEPLFEQTRQALEFDDPYVPERLLASCYGVAMSLWADPDGDKLRNKLPGFAQDLVTHMYATEPKIRAKHALIRQYAQGIVELAHKVDPTQIGEGHTDRVTPPVDEVDSPFRDPDVISEEEIGEVEPAFHSDFKNYTVGGLIPDRGNYDFEHDEYQQVLNQIMSRVFELGYSYERFEDIDRLIGRRYHGRSANGSKTDRYGKKYSWIAYFEMYGQRVDEGILPDWEEEVHPADADIDPSFPQAPPRWQPELPELFEGDYTGPVQWLAEGPDPDYNGLLERETVDGIEGPWVLLEGYIEEGTTDPRRIFTFLRGLLVDPSDVEGLEELLIETQYPGNRQVPEPDEDVYTYAGEIPWSVRYGPYLRDEDGSAVRNVKRAFGAEHEALPDGVPVEVTTHKYGWESHHSEMNQVSNVLFPAPALCERLNLVNHSRTLDLYDKDGSRATIYRTFPSDNAVFDSRLLYMRTDVITEYLEASDSELVWVPWGERSLQHEEHEAQRGRVSETLREYGNIHKGIIRYDAGQEG